VRAVLAVLLSLSCFARTPRERLETRRLEAVHAQRIEWMKQRVIAPALGVYRDFRAVAAPPSASSLQLVEAAKNAGVQVVAFPESAPLTGTHEGVLFLEGGLPEFPEKADRFQPKTPKEQRGLKSKFKQYPDEVFSVAGEAIPQNSLDAAFRNTSVHILARGLNESEIQASLARDRVYLAHDWLCDPAGFTFIAENDLGVYEIGDEAPLLHTHLEAGVPVQAKLKLLRGDEVVAEANDSKINYTVEQPGEYRLEAWLPVDGEDRLWIYSHPLRVGGPPRLMLPSAAPAPNVEVRTDIVYTEGSPADEGKHKLNLYLPKDQKNFPMFVFLHGGSWRTGDRAIYGALGNRFAKTGIGVAIPSYRLMPAHPHPAQIEDAAAAFAWVYRHASEFGGDPKRIYVVGHSAGGHLAALLALDDTYLKKLDVPITAIHGVASLSGVYDVSRLPGFVSEKDAPDPSPLDHVHAKAPPFLLTYCQWDYLGLPKQAREFAAALKKEFVATQLLYIPAESHITEIIHVVEDGDPIARALLNFVK
jgi:acetyl esterase/lipase